MSVDAAAPNHAKALNALADPRLRDDWFAIAWSREVEPQQLLARRDRRARERNSRQRWPQCDFNPSGHRHSWSDHRSLPGEHDHPVARGSQVALCGMTVAVSYARFTSTNNPLPCASAASSLSKICASAQCLRPSLRTIQPSILMGAPDGMGRR